MTEQETPETRLARIEEHLKSIDETLKQQVQVRHVNKDGICDAYGTVVDHDRRINQWTGALAAVALLCSMIGGFIGVIVTRVFR